MKLLAPSEDCEYNPHHYDCTEHIGQMNPALGNDQPFWPMYSFDHAAHLVWNAIARELHIAGWTDDRIKTWLQSKDARFALDGELGEALERVGEQYAKNHVL